MTFSLYVLYLSYVVHTGMVEVYWVQVIFLELYSFIHVKSESSRISVFINSSRFGLNVKFQSF